MRTLEYFQAWSHETLAKYAYDQYVQNKQLLESSEQLRQDLKAAVAEARALNIKLLQNKDDWK